MSATAHLSQGGVRAVLPVFAVACLLQLLISLLDLDLAWSRWLFTLQGGEWALKDYWLLSDLLHDGGRQLSVLMALGVIGLFLLSWGSRRLRRQRRVLAYLACAPLLASMSVSVGKQLTGIDCPWSLLPLGGDQPYLPLIQQLLAPGAGRCFPAGHASAGYAWFALYFAAPMLWPRARTGVLVAVLLLGLVFGVTQQLRGAHFLSHDLWSLVLCWTVCALLAPLMLNRTAVLNPAPAL